LSHSTRKQFTEPGVKTSNPINIFTTKHNEEIELNEIATLLRRPTCRHEDNIKVGLLSVEVLVIYEGTMLIYTWTCVSIKFCAP